MGKVASNGMIDGGLDKQAGCITLTVCAGEPTSQADIAVKALASAPLAGGDFVIADGDASGRKITTASKTSVNIAASGTADHIAVDDGTDYFVTTCTSQALIIGGTVTIPAWDREISDPT